MNIFYFGLPRCVCREEFIMHSKLDTAINFLLNEKNKKKIYSWSRLFYLAYKMKKNIHF